MPSDFSEAYGVASRWETRNFGYRYRYPWWSPGDWITANGSTTFLTGNRARTGYSISPVSASGWRNPNQYFRSIEILDPGNLSVNYISNGWEGPAGQTTREFTNIGYDWGALSEDTRMGKFWNNPSSDAYGKAVTSALNGLRGNDASLGLSLLEAHKTFSELASILRDLLNIWRSFHDLNGKLLYDTVIGGSISKAIANRYLQYQYGIKPLMRDAKELYDFVPTIYKNPLIKSVGRGSDSFQASNDVGFAHESTEHVKVVLYASVYNEGVYNLSRLGLLDPLGIAWELLPYSFLIDWGIPIGQVLSAYSASTGLSFHSGTVSRTVNSKSTQQLKGGPITPSYFEYVDPSAEAIAKAEGKKFSRQILGSFPDPSFFAKSPLSYQHIANAGALWLSAR